MHDSKSYTEQIAHSAFIEHIKVPKVLGNWEYRYLVKTKPLEPILLKHKPDVIEVGSPYFMPSIINSILSRHNLNSKVFGFWHADFPITYVGRFLKPINLQTLGENLAWKYARKNYNRMNGVLVASKRIMERMERNGVQNLHFSPLGVNSTLFHPNKKDHQLINQLKAGNSDRLILFFPHRFSREKGLQILLKAYDLLADSMDAAPTLVLAGTGPYQHLVMKAVDKYEHVHYAGFIDSKEEMARYYASADLGFALSEWETFGLSLMEALSCGLPLISAGKGAAPEHIENSGAGLVLNELTPENLFNAIKRFAEKKKLMLNIRARDYAETLSWNQCFDNQLLIYKKSLYE